VLQARHQGQGLLQGVGEVLDDDDGFGAGILQLVFQFPVGVEGVAVHHHVAGPQGAEHAHRILQQIGHHQGDAGALGQLQHVLQIGGEVPGEPVQLAVGDAHAHIDVGHPVPVLGTALLEKLAQGLEFVDVDKLRHALRVTPQPDLFHGLVSSYGSGQGSCGFSY